MSDQFIELAELVHFVLMTLFERFLYMASFFILVEPVDLSKCISEFDLITLDHLLGCTHPLSSFVQLGLVAKKVFANRLLEQPVLIPPRSLVV